MSSRASSSLASRAPPIPVSLVHTIAAERESDRKLARCQTGGLKGDYEQVSQELTQTQQPMAEQFKQIHQLRFDMNKIVQDKETAAAAATLGIAHAKRDIAAAEAEIAARDHAQQATAAANAGVSAAIEAVRHERKEIRPHLKDLDKKQSEALKKINEIRGQTRKVRGTSTQATRQRGNLSRC